MAAHISEYTNDNYAVHFKWVDCMVPKLHLDKVVIKNTNKRCIVAFP